MSAPRSLDLPPGVTRRDLDVPGGPLAALVGEAAGPAVVFVPGFTGSKEDFLPILAATRDAGYSLVAYDQRGQFESPGPDDPTAYTVDALASDLLHVIDLAAPADPVHLVGHSFGGLVSRAAVINAPDRMRSLALLDSGPAALGGVRAERMAFVRPLLEAGGLPVVWAAAKELEKEDARVQGRPAEISEFLERRFLSNSPTALLAMGEALLAEADRCDDLRACGLPTLVAYGADDDAWSPAEQQEMARRLGADCVVIEGAYHSPAAEAPEMTAKLLIDFWSRTDDRAG